MSNRASSFYINPTYRSTIFNFTDDLPSEPTRRHKARSSLYVPKSPSKVERKIEQDNNTHKNTGRSNTVAWNLTENSFNDPKIAYNATERNQSIDRGEMYAIQLQMALDAQKQIDQKKNSYKEELLKQIEERHNKQLLKRVQDLTVDNTGIVVGEEHHGLDVHQHAKNMKRRDDIAAKAKSRNLREGHHSQLYMSQALKNTSQSSLNPTKTQTNNDPISSEQLVKGVGEKPNYADYLTGSVASTYSIQRVHHNKLKESILNQTRNCEEYTVRVIESQRNRKKVVLQDAKEDLGLKTSNKLAAVNKEKELNRNNRWLDIHNFQPIQKENVIGLAGKLSQESKEMILNKIIENEDHKQQPKERKSSVPVRKSSDAQDRFKRLIDDTVKKMAQRSETKVSQQKPQQANQQRSRSAMGFRKN